MRTEAGTPEVEDAVGPALAEVRELVLECMADTSLHSLVSEYNGLVANGKMLRARLGLRVGSAANIPHATLVHAAAAVEMVHAASLLHDDVIDGGHLRRGAPAFWVERGIPGAILLGDLLLLKALDLVAPLENGRLSRTLVRLTGELCEAETEQELVLRGSISSWEECVSIARRKTGPLFAFMGYTCGGEDAELCKALLQAGYAIGTAYQLADDILDANGDPDSAGKTLGSDAARRKTTAATASPTDEAEPLSYIERLCTASEDGLARWPAVQKAWTAFMSVDFRPTLDRNLASLAQ